jgi:hypothetical protein
VASPIAPFKVDVGNQPAVTAAAQHLVCVDRLDIGFDDWGAAAISLEASCDRYRRFNYE